MSLVLRSIESLWVVKQYQIRALFEKNRIITLVTMAQSLLMRLFTGGVDNMAAEHLKQVRS